MRVLNTIMCAPRTKSDAALLLPFLDVGIIHLVQSYFRREKEQETRSIMAVKSLDKLFQKEKRKKVQYNLTDGITFDKSQRLNTRAIKNNCACFVCEKNNNNKKTPKKTTSWKSKL